MYQVWFDIHWTEKFEQTHEDEAYQKTAVLYMSKMLGEVRRKKQHASTYA